MKSAVCLMLIVAVWLISISISLPLAIYQKVSIAQWRTNHLAGPRLHALTAPYSHSSFIHLWKQLAFSSKIAAVYTRQSEML